MDCIGIICNSDIRESAVLAYRISEHLQKNGVSCHTAEDGEHLPESCECVLVLGGDGTLLHAAKSVLERQLPLLGINLGGLGYLAEVEVSGVCEAVDRLLDGQYTVEKRMMLEGEVVKGGQVIMRDTALNDIYIKGTGALRSYRFRNYVNGEYLSTLTADGVILSTATGSTGYNLSVGGPIVSPEAKAVLMTPIAPHSLVASRTIIFSGSDRISVAIGEGRTGPAEDIAFVRFDGSQGVSLDTGDLVRVSKSERCTNLIKINHISFLEVLRKKMSES